MCNRWLVVRTETYRHDNDVRCLHDDADGGLGAHLGFRWDLPEEENVTEEIPEKVGEAAEQTDSPARVGL